jgi:hypothetical protein
MGKIGSKEELLKKLKIDNIKDLKNPKVQKKFIDVVKANEISPALLKDILAIVPELTTAFTMVIKAMSDIGTSLEETKRLRWQVLQQVASSGNLTGDQILEAMHILQEIEKNERIDWESVFKIAFSVIGGIAVIVIFILSGGKVKLK